MSPLHTPDLETIQRLLVEPLRQAIAAEVQAGHERLTLAIEKLSDGLSRHIVDSAQRDNARESRLMKLEKRTGILEQFHARLLAAYTALVILCSLVWSILRDWLIAVMTHR